MAKYCPLKNGPALYPECLECTDKPCKGRYTKGRYTAENPIRIIIAGSRDFSDYQLVRRVMSEVAGTYPRERLEIISGGARGADTLGEMFAERNGLKLTRFPADWDKFGKRAGILRNRQMAEYAGEDGMLVAFWDEISRGTKNMIETAKELGLFVRIVSLSQERYGQTIGEGTDVLGGKNQ